MTEEVINLTPDQAMHAALDLQRDGKIRDAEQIFRGVLEIDPKNFQALNHLAALLAGEKKYYEALYRVDRALTINKRSANALSNRGMILGQLGHLEESEGDFRRALHLEPHNHVFWNNLGNTLERMGRYEEAFMALNKTLALAPNHAFTYLNRGIVLQRLGRYKDSILSFNRALELDSTINEARYNRGIVRLLLGDFKNGLVDYEARLVVEEGSYYLGPFSQPQWTGKESLEGKDILIHAEQGIGDTIQFMRYVPMVYQRGPRHIFMVSHTPVRSLLEKTPGVTVLSPGSQLPAFDYWSPLMSLPLAFGTEMDTIPPPWDLGIKFVGNSSPIRQVGICWSGNWKHKNDHHRSVKLDKFSCVMDVTGVNFHCLQNEIRQEDEAKASELGLKALDVKSFEDTISCVHGLDLVITVDTAVAHLVGTLGIPTWTLIPLQATDFRWGLRHEDTPWYPSMRLFRQSEVGNWDFTLKEIRKNLKDSAVNAQRAA
jgi:Flp pilus assembly protein TadD